MVLLKTIRVHACAEKKVGRDATNIMVRDLDIAARDGRRLEIVVDGLPFVGVSSLPFFAGLG